MSDERFVFYPTSNYIKDRETDHTYFCNNKNVCKLLNELNDMNNQLVCQRDAYKRAYEEVKEVMRKYNIYSNEKLDQVLMNERTW